MSTQLDAIRAFVGPRPSQRENGNVAVLAAGKGGVGTSTLAALLAAGAARAGTSTLLVDAAASGASLASVLGMSAEGGDATMMVRIAPRLMFAAQPRDVVTAIERRSRMRRLAAGFGEQPFVVIDAGASVDAINGALLAGASRLVAVTSIDRLGIAATYALIKLIGAQFPALPVSVLVNRADPADATNAFGQIATGVEQFLGCNTVFAGSIPEDATIAAAMEAGLSPTETTGSAAQAAELLANLLMITGAGRPGRPLIARIS